MLFQSIFLKKVVKILQQSAFSYQVKNLKHIFTRSDIFIIFQEFQSDQAYGMWIFQEFLTFFKCPNVFFPQFWTYFIFSHRQNIFQNCLWVTYLRNIKVRSPSVSWFSPRLYLIWREFHASSTFHIFRGNLGNQTMKKCSLCRNRQLTRFIWEEEIKFFIGLYFFFSHDPLMKRQTRNGMFVPVAQCTA